MKKTIEKVGTFENQTGRMIVSDPCYDILKHGYTWFDNVVKGTWEAEIEFSKSGLVNRIEARSIGRDGGQWNRIDLGICVDSGQLTIVDHFDGFGKGEDDDESSWYGMICKLTGNGKNAAIVDWENRKIGVACSGFGGDGKYDGYIEKDENGGIIGIKVLFNQNRR